jgi:hypothetical protein
MITDVLAMVLSGMLEPLLFLPAILVGIAASRLSTVLIASIIVLFIHAVIQAHDPIGLTVGFMVDCLLVFAMASGARERRRQQAKVDRSAIQK